MKVEVLGSVEASLGGAPVDLGTRKQRALVAVLALGAGRPVSVDTIIDTLWPDDPPAGVAGTLQAYVAGLRKALEPDRPPRAPATVLVTVAPGYALRIADDALDARVFDGTVSTAHRRLGRGGDPTAPPDLSAEELQQVVSDLDAALGLWRGTPYVELEDAPGAVAERVRLEELRLVALEDRAVAQLALGQHATVAGDLESLTTAHPLRERLWALRALALTRAGRQAEALDALRQVREVLDEELGLEPSAELRDLQSAVLRQDPRLAWHPPRSSAVTAPTSDLTSGAAATAAPTVPSTEAPVLTATDAAEQTAGPTSHPSTGSGPAASPAAAAPGTQPDVDGSRPEEPAQRHTRSPYRPWPLVGRDEQLAELTALLDAAEQGVPSFATLVGEPGIGKSRLSAELAAAATGRGATVLLGRCSQDEGAPPLWPWASVLRGLGESLPVSEGDDGGGAFRTWDGIVDLVLRAARDRTLVIVLDDLHWADVASLRVLRLLAELADGGRLLVVGTWRDHPAPEGPFAEVVEFLARRHATRLHLEGLPPDAVGELVEAVASSAASPIEAEALRGRTDGNPFFLVEYARLAKVGGDLSKLLDEATPPSAVADVVVRRLQRLPEPTVASLRTAAVIGREFDLDTLATTLGRNDEDILDELDPALAAGLLRDDGGDRFRFAHALVRDTAYAGLPASRRSRWHARVAEALETQAGRETEVAHHWLGAGPSHAARAWRSAVAATTVTRRLHAHEQGAELLRSALAALPNDPSSTTRDRYDVLMGLAENLRWMGDWESLVAVVEDAIDVAEQLGDVELLAEAATATAVGALWQSGPHGSVSKTVVAALRRCLDRLPATDGSTRCRVMLSLALEIYYRSSHEERVALVEEGLAMARRLGDDDLLLDAYQLAFTALWSPSTTPLRHELITEAVELARRLGRERAYVVSATLRTVVAGELGLTDEMWEWAAESRRHAERLRLPYGIMVLDTLELPWLAMRGDFDACEERLASIIRSNELMTIKQGDEAAAGAILTLRVWQGRPAEAVEISDALEGETFLPIDSAITAMRLRMGDLEGARRHHALGRIDLTPDTWYAMLNWCLAAETALGLGDRDLAADAYARLAPFAGYSCSAGSGNAMGPVDAFLAMAAAAVGETDLAARHADRAEGLCVAWQIPLAAKWYRGQRDRYGY